MKRRPRPTTSAPGPHMTRPKPGIHWDHHWNHRYYPWHNWYDYDWHDYDYDYDYDYDWYDYDYDYDYDWYDSHNVNYSSAPMPRRRAGPPRPAQQHTTAEDMHKQAYASGYKKGIEKGIKMGMESGCWPPTPEPTPAPAPAPIPPEEITGE